MIQRRHADRSGSRGQFAAVDDILTGSENLTLVGRLNHLSTGQARARSHELLERFELVEAGHRQAKTYSGGMRRRLDLAAALVARPAVLFLDEPTTGLDPRSRIDLWKVIEDLVAEGTTLLLTTQYLEEADRLADQIAVVDSGRVIAEGTSSELKGRLGGSTIEIRLADDTEARHAAERLSGIGEGNVTVDGAFVHVPATDGTTTLTEVVRRLDDEHITARGLQLREPSLDDVFLALTGTSTAHDAQPPPAVQDRTAEETMGQQ
jgi:ABC-2 type transport system ATP-binding protein